MTGTVTALDSTPKQWAVVILNSGVVLTIYDKCAYVFVDLLTGYWPHLTSQHSIIVHDAALGTRRYLASIHGKHQ